MLPKSSRYTVPLLCKYLRTDLNSLSVTVINFVLSNPLSVPPSLLLRLHQNRILLTIHLPLHVNAAASACRFNGGSVNCFPAECAQSGTSLRQAKTIVVVFVAAAESALDIGFRCLTSTPIISVRRPQPRTNGFAKEIERVCHQLTMINGVARLFGFTELKLYRG